MNEVKKPKKPLIYYYIIVMIVLMLFNLLAMPLMSQGQIVEVDYGTFMSMTENGKIGKVQVQESENQIIFTDKIVSTFSISSYNFSNCRYILIL